MKSLIIGLIYLVVIGGVVLLFRRLIQNAENRQVGNSADSEKKTKSKPSISIIPVQDFWELENLYNGVLVLKPGNRYRAIVAAGSVNYQLMSAAEKSQIEVALMNLVASVTFPIQIFSMNELCDTTHISKEIIETRHLLPESLATYAMVMIDGLNSLRYSREVLIRKNYIIVSYDENVPFEKGANEVMRRAGSIIDGLNKAGISSRLLNSNEIADLMFAALNRQNISKASDVIKEGGMDLHVSGQTQIS